MIDRPPLALEDLRQVEWELTAKTLTGTAPQTQRELCPREDVDLLVGAILKLHHDPGVNPHSGKPTARLERVRVGAPALGPGHWWTGPTLQDEGAKARLVSWSWTSVFERVQEP